MRVVRLWNGLHIEIVDALLQMCHDLWMSHDFGARSLIACFALDLYFSGGSCYYSGLKTGYGIGS